MQAIDENTQVEVGRIYPVQCAVMEHRIRGGKDRRIYVPVYGHPHKDPQFGISFAHYHIDGRFTKGNGTLRDWDNTAEGRTNGIIGTEEGLGFYPEFKGVEVRLKKCRRLITGIAPPPASFLPGGKYGAWYNGMLGKSCKGRKCPHLGTEMKEVNGLLVCPLHDLHGCPKTETIIAHPLQSVHP